MSRRPLWCIVPAAGSGSRMGPVDGRQLPKQYLPLAGRPMLAWTLEALASAAPAAILLVVAPEDRFELEAGLLPATLERIADGGASRAETVMAGLRALAGRAEPHDPVLVHDAARPCLAPELLRTLVGTLATEPDGGLLALPVVDTIKAAAGEPPRVAATRDRDGLWLAQTPQLFPYGRLFRALDAALAAGVAVTDEASAVERDGGRPRLVPGSVANLKVTRPADRALAEFWLARQGRIV